MSLAFEFGLHQSMTESENSRYDSIKYKLIDLGVSKNLVNVYTNTAYQQGVEHGEYLYEEEPDDDYIEDIPYDDIIVQN
jgi:hypothetical protein